MSRLSDAFHALVGRADDEIALVDQFIKHEEKEIETVITDALNALAEAVNNALAERTSDRASLAQAQTDRDAAQAQVAQLQGQLSDAETQIAAITAQLA